MIVDKNGAMMLIFVRFKFERRYHILDFMLSTHLQRPFINH